MTDETTQELVEAVKSRTYRPLLLAIEVLDENDELVERAVKGRVVLRTRDPSVLRAVSRVTTRPGLVVVEVSSR